MGLQSSKKKVDFEIQVHAGSEVYLAGDFNDWNPGQNALYYNKSSQCFRTTMNLAPGTYEYKFFINGQWCIDPKNPNFTISDIGALNSKLNVD